MRFLAAFLLLTAVAFAQVPPPGQTQTQSPPPPASGFISGRVVDAVTGKPIAEAMVLINGRAIALMQAQGGGRGAAPVGPQPVLTDSQGRFFFSGLTPGMYTAQIAKMGYFNEVFGPVELAANERLLDLQVKLEKLASVSGTVRDESGDPVVGANMMVFRRTAAYGRQTWYPMMAGRSDDRGAYRVANLRGGDFIVCACGTRDALPIDTLLMTTLGSEPVQLLNVAARALSVGADAVSLDNTLRTWAPTFHPNSPSTSRATKITVAAGEDKAGIDVQVPLVRAARISGRIVGGTGPVDARFMQLIPEADAEIGQPQAFSIAPMLVQPDGRFDFTTIAPGQYRLIMLQRQGLATNAPSGAAMAFAGARGQALPPAGATMSSAGGPVSDSVMWASEPITVGENGVNGWMVTLRPSLSISGRVQWIGGAPQPPANMLNRVSLLLQATDPSDLLASAVRSAVGRFSPDASFVVNGVVPGKWSANLQALPGFPTLKSVMLGGQDITDLPIVVGDKELANLVLTFVDTPMASLTINVTGAPDTKNDNGSVLVFPSDRKYWADPGSARRRFRQVANPPNGTATTPDMPTGDYLAVYASKLEAGDWQETSKLEALAKRAQRVTIGDTGKAAVEVRR